MKSIFYKIIYFMTGAFCLMASSCADDFPYSYRETPDGEGTLSAIVTFTPITTANLGGTRAPGDTLNAIRSLNVLVYTLDGKLYEAFSSNSMDEDRKLTYSVGEYIVKDDDHLDGNEAHTDQQKTAKASFSLKNLSYGNYKIYAVANMDDLYTDEKTFKDKDGNEVAIKDAIQTEEGLKRINLTWNPNDVPANNQMFGYFTPADDMESKGFDAPTITFDKPQINIHAWLKRAASKVTVAFDPSGLRQGVNIYIRNVTIRDIPKNCFLGAENSPSSIEELDNHLNTPYPTPNFEEPSDAIANTRFEYNSQGLITDPDVHTGSDKTDGYVLNNHIRNAVPIDAHDSNAPSLFFFENNQQPDYDNMTSEQKKRYDKRQQHSGQEDGVGKPVRDEKDKEGKLTDLKDKVPFGTYIEVEAYYISSNPDKVGEGTIKYRFMLGKDAIDNYDAERNYHFKLTLGFNGWANDPDWHIDYELPQPGLEVPPVFRVSYLYHQVSELPIRILGDCTDLQVTITENNWAPYDPSGSPYQVPPAKVVAPKEDTCDEYGEYDFEWNRDAYLSNIYMQNGQQVPYFGFLALHMPNKGSTTVIDRDYGPEANTQLRNYYINNMEGERRFNRNDLGFGEHPSSSFDGTVSSDDAYKVEKVLNDLNQEIPNEKTLMLPVWTRALALIRDSGFSGNNPYEGFERKAVLHIEATFSDGTKRQKDVTVLQVKRIVNPKGVWRASDKTTAFNVTLLEAKNSNGMSNFQAFPSEGEWTAYIEKETNGAGFTLSKNDKTDGYIENGVIHGYTGSTIDFRINFGAEVADTISECAIVKVLYHGNQCLHKILIRKGYNAPMRMGGKLWSSYSLYQATYREGTVGSSDIYDAELTKNPLMLGSMFRRGMQGKGIFVSNNMKEDLGPFMPPESNLFEIGLRNGNAWAQQDWNNIGYRDDVFTAPTTWYIRPGRAQGGQSWGLGTFYVGDQPYKVPSYDDFLELTKAAEFGYGVVYGSSATEPQMIAKDAYGLIDPNNEGLFDDPNGMRGVIAYEKSSGDQIFFPMGKYGTGRRNAYTFLNGNAGQLRYGDVSTVLSSANDTYRPIPYNLKIASGNIYWIDKYQPNVRTQYTNAAQRGCLGWDMNYFNFDFNAYTANNWCDACPIKLILVE